MTRLQAQSFRNVGFREKDCYKGKTALQRYRRIDYGFVNHWDNMVSDGKRIFGGYVLIHDFNQYGHSERSGHYGAPDDGQCMAVDYHWVGIPIYSQLMLALKWRFNGVFVYPFVKVPFIHVDWKDWDRPEGIITFGYQSREGNIITSNRDFNKVIDAINLLCKLVDSGGEGR